MKQDKLAVIGAGEAAIPVINKAKSLNIETIVFGQKGSLAEDLADIFIENDIFDKEGICKACRDNEVNGVIASSEISTEVAAEIACELGLPGNDVSRGFAGRNKYLMRCRIQKLKSVRQPRFELYKDNKVYNLPVVVKAIDSCGKQGVSLVKSSSEFKEAVQYAQRFSSDGSALIEEYLEGGQEYSIECMAFEGTCYVIQYTQKDSTGAPHFVEVGHHQPALLSEDIKRKINQAAQDILSELGITCGMAHLELKIINQELFFIEVGARAGGGHIGDTLIGLSTDFDYYKAAILCSLGKFKPSKINTKASAGIYFYCKQTENLSPLFEKAKSANWCYINQIHEQKLVDVTCSTERSKSSFIIYNADHKITKDNYLNDIEIKAIEINNFANAYELIWNHCKEIGRDLTDEELDLGIKKFLAKAHVLAIVRNNHILAFSILYCNNYDTLQAYICNVFVLQEYRGLGYSSKLISKAIEICKAKNFKTIALHVKEDNMPAVNLYKKFGFVYTGNHKNEVGNEQSEMRFTF